MKAKSLFLLILRSHGRKTLEHRACFDLLNSSSCYSSATIEQGMMLRKSFSSDVCFDQLNTSMCNSSATGVNHELSKPQPSPQPQPSPSALYDQLLFLCSEFIGVDLQYEDKHRDDDRPEDESNESKEFEADEYTKDSN